KMTWRVMPERIAEESDRVITVPLLTIYALLDPPSVTTPFSCMNASNAPEGFACCFASTCASIDVLLMSRRAQRISATLTTLTPRAFGSVNRTLERAYEMTVGLTVAGN